MNIEQISGIGPGLATAIRRTFPNDAAFFEAAKNLDVQAIAAVEGISEQRAVDLIRTVAGGSDSSWLGTPAARKLHDDIIDRIQRFAATRAGKNRLRLLSPLSTPEQAAERAAHVMAQKARVAAIDRLAVRKALRTVQELRSPTPVCDTTTLVVAADDEAYERLHAMEAHKWAVLGTRRDLAHVDDYDVVVAVGHMDVGHVPHVVELPEDAPPWRVLPQKAMAWAHENEHVLRALEVLADGHEQTTAASEVLAHMSPPATTTPAALQQIAEEILVQAEADLAHQAQSLQLSSADWLAAAGGRGMPKPLATAMDDVLRAAHDAFRARTGVSGRILIAGLPLSLDEEELERLEQDMAASGNLRRYEQAAAAAAVIAGQRDGVTAEVAAWVEGDADFALGCFALHHDLHPAVIGSSFDFCRSVHLGLTGLNAEPIAYRLGGQHPIAVLTGANSGGKSTLLEHLCQLAISARLGLPVVGEQVGVPWIEEIHLVTARKGLDAGAFETFLRGFLPMAQGDKRRLVLADEVESVTELEAAGRILAFFLDRIAATDSLAVVVTHMAPQLLRHVRSDVRVDGIEAVGLDDNDELVVRRCPRMGAFARSTPELIVERLTRRTRGADAALYKDLLAALRDSETGK